MRLAMSVISSVAFLAIQCCFPTPAAAQTLDTPQFTSSSIAGCRGTYILDWTAVAGATSYQLWVEFPGTTSYFLSHTVTSNEAFVHAQNAGGLTLFEVEACDASGCGGFSSPIGLSWYNGCP